MCNALPLNPAIHRMGNEPNLLCLRFEKALFSILNPSLNPFFLFYWKFSKITLDFISELFNLKYAFDIPIKITLKNIIIRTSSQFHDGVQLKILPRCNEQKESQPYFIFYCKFSKTTVDFVSELINLK